MMRNYGASFFHGGPYFMDIKEEDILGESIHDHWYYVAKGRALKAAIKGLEKTDMLDVGAGSGIFSKILQDDGWGTATLVDPAYPDDHDEDWHGKTLQFRRSIEKNDAKLIMMMDVLEHVPDDAALLREYAEKSEPGTYVLITVPAFQWLFSAHDLFLEHYRRYTRNDVNDMVERAGLDVVHSSYFFGFIFPLAVIVRLIEKIKLGKGKMQPKSSLKKHSAPVNAILKFICALELPFLKLNKLAGLSVFCLARVRDE